MMTGKHDPTPGDDSLATRASLLGRLKNWEDAKSWEEFTQTYSRLIRAVAIKAGLTESEAKDVEQETLLCVAKTIHEFESNPARGTFKSWLLNLRAGDRRSFAAVRRCVAPPWTPPPRALPLSSACLARTTRCGMGGEEANIVETASPRGSEGPAQALANFRSLRNAPLARRQSGA
jgi:hypothetical protein